MVVIWFTWSDELVLVGHTFSLARQGEKIFVATGDLFREPRKTRRQMTSGFTRQPQLIVRMTPIGSAGCAIDGINRLVRQRQQFVGETRAMITALTKTGNQAEESMPKTFLGQTVQSVPSSRRSTRHRVLAGNLGVCDYSIPVDCN